MAHYIFIESRDPFESNDVNFIAEMATSLEKKGNEVTVFLVQNGVLGARKGARGSTIPEFATKGIAVLADDFSLKERGIGADDCHDGVQESSIEELVEMLVQKNTKALWH